MAGKRGRGQRKFGDTEFSIRPLRKNVAEVRMHGITYMFESKRGYSKMEASGKRGVIESAESVHKGDEIRISMRHHSGSTLTFTRDQVSTEVEMDGRSYAVQSDLPMHAIELARTLRGKKGPRWRMKD